MFCRYKTNPPIQLNRFCLPEVLLFVLIALIYVSRATLVSAEECLTSDGGCTVPKSYTGNATNGPFNVPLSGNTTLNIEGTLKSGNTFTISGVVAVKTINGSNIVNVGPGKIETSNLSGNYPRAYGVLHSGNKNKTFVSGSISTIGDGTPGVYNEGDDNETTVSGSISTTGGSNNSTPPQPEFAYGIANKGNGNIATVSSGGSITTEGINAHGVYYDGNTNTMTVSQGGSITTAESDAAGIYYSGNNNTTTVGGEITTTGSGGLGVSNNGDSSATTVSGSITTRGVEAAGIYNFGDSNRTTVSGDIITSGVRAYGIYNRGNSNTTTVSNGGSIKTSGSGAHGIYNLGNDNSGTLAAGGSITTTGSEADGIVHEGNNNTAFISGTVSATGTGSAALYNASGTGNSFTLNEGAILIGSVSASNVASNNTLTFDADMGYKLTVGGVGLGTGAGEWTFVSRDTQGADEVELEYIKVDNSNCAADVTVCYVVVGAKEDIPEQQDDIQMNNNDALIVSLVGSRGDLRTVWANIYGVNAEGDETASRSEFSSRTAGLTIGVPVPTDNGLDWDLVFNTSNSVNDLGVNGSQKLTVQSYNFGLVLYDIIPSNNWSVDAFGFIGYNDYDKERDVLNNTTATGIETIKSSYSGSEALIGFDAEYVKPFIDSLDLTFGVQGALSREKINSFTSGYYTYDERRTTQGSGGISAGVEYNRGPLMAYAKLGATYVSLLDGETFNYDVNGEARTFTDDDTDDLYGRINVGFEYNKSERLLFRGDFSGISSTGGITGYAASLGFELKF
ncbi:beta strand repeat-containing protein [Pseudopelagicola sp. nBUS_20]|uniref:beta strand repeat-containing protein n=1 Tax=Pseudopelagicola sp. nBUS_20 TaxID=3395317 RepID=UPI003EBAC4B6